MRIAILRAARNIAKDLVLSLYAQSSHELVLHARQQEVVSQWLASAGLVGQYGVADFAAISADAHFDALLNFMGVGNPAQAAALGASIFDVTLKYDEMALDYVRKHPQCRYIFLISGAVYDSSFDAPVDEITQAVISINKLEQQYWYGVAKLHAECRHRSLPHLPIVDVRVFNYFSHTQDIQARFLITDILRAIRNETILQTSSDYIVRDFLHPADFYQLASALLTTPATNTVVDCYSRAPIDKPNLLAAMQEKFGLQYEITQAAVSVNATGGKCQYYSLNTRATEFGYKPALTSLEGILQEATAMLQQQTTQVGSS